MTRRTTSWISKDSHSEGNNQTTGDDYDSTTINSNIIHNSNNFTIPAIIWSHALVQEQSCEHVEVVWWNSLLCTLITPLGNPLSLATLSHNLPSVFLLYPLNLELWFHVHGWVIVVTLMQNRKPVTTGMGLNSGLLLSCVVALLTLSCVVS